MWCATYVYSATSNFACFFQTYDRLDTSTEKSWKRNLFNVHLHFCSQACWILFQIIPAATETVLVLVNIHYSQFEAEFVELFLTWFLVNSCHFEKYFLFNRNYIIETVIIRGSVNFLAFYEIIIIFATNIIIIIIIHLLFLLYLLLSYLLLLLLLLLLMHDARASPKKSVSPLLFVSLCSSWYIIFV